MTLTVSELLLTLSYIRINMNRCVTVCIISLVNMDFAVSGFDGF